MKCNSNFIMVGILILLVALAVSFGLAQEEGDTYQLTNKVPQGGSNYRLPDEFEFEPDTLIAQVVHLAGLRNDQFQYHGCFIKVVITDNPDSATVRIYPQISPDGEIWDSLGIYIAEFVDPADSNAFYYTMNPADTTIGTFTKWVQVRTKGAVGFGACPVPWLRWNYKISRNSMIASISLIPFGY